MLLPEYVEIAPAKAKHKKKIPWGDPLWRLEEKLDGWRFLMHFGKELERVYMTGRRVSKVTDTFSEKGLCCPTLWPPFRNQFGYTVIDGEVLSPTGFHDIASIMNVAPDKAAKKIAEVGSPRYVAFDILFHNDKDVRDLSLLERRMLLEEVLTVISDSNISIIKQHPADEALFTKITDAGGEGVVLKDLIGTYGENWIKVKGAVTLDVIITDFRPGVGKYAGQIGSVMVSVYNGGELIEIGRVSGMTDEVRWHMTQNRGEWLGQVIEVAAQGMARNRLRHPRYKRTRADVDARSCTLRKLMGDVAVAGPAQPKLPFV